MVVHTAILLLILSGAFNAWRAWPVYNRWPGVTHGIFGLHLLLGLGIFALLLVLTAGREARRGHDGLVRWALVLMFVAVAAASTLKWARERAHDRAAESGSRHIQAQVARDGDHGHMRAFLYF